MDKPQIFRGPVEAIKTEHCTPTAIQLCSAPERLSVIGCREPETSGHRLPHCNICVQAGQHQYGPHSTHLDVSNKVKVTKSYFVSAVIPESRRQVGTDCHTAIFVCKQDNTEMVLTALGAFWILVYIVWFHVYLLQEFRFLKRSGHFSKSIRMDALVLQTRIAAVEAASASSVTSSSQSFRWINIACTSAACWLGALTVVAIIQHCIFFLQGAIHAASHQQHLCAHQHADAPHQMQPS